MAMDIRSVPETVKNNPVVVGKAVAALAAVAAVVGIAHPSADQVAAVSGAIVAVNGVLALVVRAKVVPTRKLPGPVVDESVHPAMPDES